MEQGKTQARLLTAQDWEEHKDAIKLLYLVHENSLSDVIHIMREQHSFSASPKQYKTYLKRWGVEKNMKLADMHHIIRIAKRRRNEEKKETVFVVRNHQVPRHKIERWMRRPIQLLKAGKNEAKLIPRPVTPPEIRYQTPTPGSPVAGAEPQTLLPEPEVSPQLGSLLSPPTKLLGRKLPEIFWTGERPSNACRAASHAVTIRREGHTHKCAQCSFCQGDTPSPPAPRAISARVAVNLAQMREAVAPPPLLMAKMDSVRYNNMVSDGCHFPDIERLVGTEYIIDNLDLVSSKLLNYIDQNMSVEIVNLVYKLDDLVWKTYLMAFRQIAEAPTCLERTLMVNVFRLCLGALNSSQQVDVVIDSHFGVPTLRHTLSMIEIATASRREFMGQLRMTLRQKLLCPWSLSVLEGLDTMIRSGRREYWFTTYLACFILLHGAVLLEQADSKLTRLAGPDNRPSHRAAIHQHQGAMRVLLGFYHYSCDMFRPFELALRPERAKDLASLAGLSDEQVAHVTWTAHFMKDREHLSTKAQQENSYEDDYYWISQLFDAHWWQTCGMGMPKTLSGR